MGEAWHLLRIACRCYTNRMREPVQCIVLDLLVTVRGGHLKDTGLGLEESCRHMGGLYSFECKVASKCLLTTVRGSIIY